MEKRVLHNINFAIEKGTFNCIIGHTGSGKSTLMQHLNALLLPDEGIITLPAGTIEANKKIKGKDIKPIRRQVGLVFQFPEYQLFETTVLKDIMFGPMNYGETKEEAEISARKAAEIVGIGSDLLDQSPFELSGGQMRRVAIAGILAMNPDVIVLDEPTAGLDPRGRKEILEIFINLQKQGKTIIVATHDMDLVATYANHVIILREGKILLDGTPQQIFSQPDEIKKAGVYLPTAAAVYKDIYGQDDNLPLTLTDFITKVVEKRK